MKKYLWATVGLVLAALTTLPQSARAEDNGPEWRFRVGLSYVHGIWKSSDAMADYYERHGDDVEHLAIPVGLHLDTSVEWPVHELVSVGPELRVGPAMVNGVIKEDLSDDTRDFDLSLMLPLSLSARATFLPKAKVSPYIRAGVAYVVATGSLMDDSEVGFEGAGGLEFFRNKRFGFGLEGGYNTCEVKVGGRNVKPVEFFASVYATIKLGR